MQWALKLWSLKMTDQKAFLQNISIIFYSSFTIYPFSCWFFFATECFQHFLLFDLCSSQGRKIQNYYSWSELETDKTGVGIFNSFSKRGSHSFCCNVLREPNTYTEQHIFWRKVDGKRKSRIHGRWMRGRSVCSRLQLGLPRVLGPWMVYDRP